MAIGAFPEGSVAFLVPLFIVLWQRPSLAHVYRSKIWGTTAPQISRVPVKSSDIYEVTVECHAYTF